MTRHYRIDLTEGNLEALRYIEEHLRPIDRKECRAVDEPVFYSVAMSDYAFVVHVDDTPCGVFGLVTHYQTLADGGLSEYIAVPWLLGTPDLTRYPREFMQLSRRWVDAFIGITHENIMWNLCLRENMKARSWLSHLGFEFPEDEELPEWIGFYL